MHPPQRDRRGERDRFDHVAEGARYGLSRDLSRAIWERASADSTDAAGRRDADAAVGQFHAIAARMAARGGRVHPDVGRLTRVGVELDGNAAPASRRDPLGVRAPGRETLVTAEAWRWAGSSGEAAVAYEVSATAEGSGRHEHAPGRSELPGGDAVMQAMAALQATMRPARAEPPGQGLARDAEIFDGAVLPLGGGRGAATASVSSAGAEALPFRDHFERALGLDLGLVSVRRGQREALRPLGARAATRGTHVDFFDERPSRELVGHELVHVLQNLGAGGSAHGVSERGDAAEGEAEALGPRLAAGQFVVPRARPSAAVQLDRDQNLDLQWEREVALKKQFPRDGFIAEAKRLFAIIQDSVPAFDAAARAEQVWTLVMAAFKTASMDEDNLDKETQAYTAVLDELGRDVAVRLTLASEAEVKERAAAWKSLQQFCPQATPFVLLQKLYETLATNSQARRTVATAIPAEAEYQRAMQDTWDQARKLDAEVPAADLTAAATGYRGEVLDNVRRDVANVSPTSRVAAYQRAMDEIARSAQTALTPPKPAEVVQRVRAIANLPALEDMAPTEAMDPSFEDSARPRLMNEKVRTAFLGDLGKAHPRDKFVAALLALYPRLATSKALQADAEAFYDEELLRLRTLVEQQSLAMAPEDYTRTLARIDAVEVQPALDIPKIPRQYHTNAADESREDQQFFAEHGIIQDENLEVVGAERAEVSYIKNYLSTVDLAKNSEHRLIAPIGPAPDDQTAAPRGRLLVTVDDAGHAVARLAERNPSPGEAIEDSVDDTAKLQKSLAARFGLGGFDVEGGAAWTTSEVRKLAAALERIPAGDRGALQGITFVRAKDLDKKDNEGRTLGLFTVRPVNRCIKLADVAFQGDQFAFAGTREVVPSSTQVALHEIAHAIEHQPQLDAQANLADVAQAAPQGRLFNDELDALDRAQPASIAGELRGLLVLASSALIGKPRGKALFAIAGFVTSVEALLDDAGAGNRAACNDAWNEMVAHKQAIAELLAEDEAKRIVAIKSTAMKYVAAVENAPELQDKLHKAEADLAKKQELHQAALEQARKQVAATTSAEDDARSRRLQSFIDFVVQCGIRPTITAYAESAWEKGKHGEFFAEAYALWISDPQFLRRNFQPLYLYFQNGMHREG